MISGDMQVAINILGTNQKIECIYNEFVIDCDTEKYASLSKDQIESLNAHGWKYLTGPDAWCLNNDGWVWKGRFK